MSGEYLGAREAAGELGVSVATLYSYVSRGFIRSESTSGGGRERRYRAEDVARLKDRAERRRNPDGVVSGALDWGTPIMDSSISLVEDDRLFYRGRDVVSLSRENTVEEVASLLWTGDMGDAGALFEGSSEGGESIAEEASRVRGITPVERYQVALTLAASRDPGAYDLSAGAVARRGAKILSLGVRIVSGRAAGISDSLAVGWGVDERARGLLDAVLVLCADHELPVSTFAARCVASSRATPYAVVQAGLAALGGTLHGGVIRLVESFVREVEYVGDAGKVVRDRLRRGEGIPGFGGHRLYPGGDPRGREILTRISGVVPGSSEDQLAGEIIAAVREIVGDPPTVDFGLVMLERALSLPEEAAFSLFAIGRSAGWISHAIEQYREESLIRPRSRYVGELPDG